MELHTFFKLFKPSCADLVKNLFGSSAARSQYIRYFHSNQPKKCQNDVFLENRVQSTDFSKNWFRYSIWLQNLPAFELDSYHEVKCYFHVTAIFTSCEKTSSLRSGRKMRQFGIFTQYFVRHLDCAYPFFMQIGRQELYFFAFRKFEK